VPDDLEDAMYEDGVIELKMGDDDDGGSSNYKD
jgi:hypothetical protein